MKNKGMHSSHRPHYTARWKSSPSLIDERIKAQSYKDRALAFIPQEEEWKFNTKPSQIYNVGFFHGRKLKGIKCHQVEAGPGLKWKRLVINSPMLVAEHSGSSSWKVEHNSSFKTPEQKGRFTQLWELIQGFHGDPVIKTLSFPCRGWGFSPWLGKIPHATRPKTVGKDLSRMCLRRRLSPNSP